MIYIVIPVYNRLYFTRACLNRLAMQTYRDFEVVLVDHGSTDGTGENIQKDYPWVTILPGDAGMWWTAATNLGVQYAMSKANLSDHILTLNNDLEVDRDYLKNLNDATGVKPDSIIGSVSKDIANRSKIVFAGTKWNSVTAKFKTLTDNNIPPEKYAKNFIKSDLLPGRGTLIPAKVFKQIGLFDEHNFPHYAADEDFSLRARKAGYKLYVHAKCFVLSHVNASGIKFKNKRIAFPDFIKSLISIRSANNLKIRWRWAVKNTPLPLLYFGLDASRIFFSYLRGYFNFHV